MKKYKIENGVLYESEVKQKSRGECPFCNKPVYALPNQAIKYLIKTYKNRQGEVVSQKEHPTHKACRKGKR